MPSGVNRGHTEADTLRQDFIRKATEEEKAEYAKLKGFNDPPNMCQVDTQLAWVTSCFGGVVLCCVWSWL
jgi:hypothetical protein